MADDEATPRTTATTNYAWVKPDVGASDDVWGGLLNTDLDGIDSTVKGVSNVANAAQTAAQVATAITAYSVGDNRIINGDMRIDQRNNGASGTVQGYTVDRWQFITPQPGKLTWQRSLTNNVGLGFPYSLSMQATTAYTPLASDYFVLIQNVEADMVSDFAWGNSGAQPATLSFMAGSTGVTGTFSGAVSNFAGTRSYPFSFSIPSAGVWTKIVVTIPGDTTGTWVLSGNAASLVVRFDAGSGATWRGAAGAWANGNYVGVTGAQSIVPTLNAAFFVTGVKLEIGSVATPFNRQSLAKSMADCQRYYQTIISTIRFVSTASQTSEHTLSYFTMRAAPTAVIVTTGVRANLAPTYPQILPQSNNSARFAGVSAAAGDCYAVADLWSLSAEL